MDIGLAVVIVPVRECDAGPALLVVPVREWSGTTESEAGARAGRAMRLRMGMRWDNTSYPNAPKLNTAKGRLTDQMNFLEVFQGRGGGSKAVQRISKNYVRSG